MYNIKGINEAGDFKVAEYLSYDTAYESMNSLTKLYGKGIEVGQVEYPQYFITNKSGTVMRTSIDPKLSLSENLTRIDLMSDFRVYWGSIPECSQGLGGLILIGETPLVGLDPEELKSLHKKYTHYFKNPLPVSQGLNPPKDAKI